MSILRSQGLERLLNLVEAHRPLVTALRSQDPIQIRAEFQKGATPAPMASSSAAARNAPY